MKFPLQNGKNFFISISLCLFFLAHSNWLCADSSSESQFEDGSSQVSTGNEVGLQKWDILTARFLELSQAEKFEEALEVGGQMLELSMKVFGPSHPNTALVLSVIADTYESLQQLMEAEQYYRLALDIYEEAWGSLHVNLLPDLRSLGLVLLEQKEWTKAESVYARALSLHENAVGSTDVDLTQDLENLALVHRMQGNLEQAEALYQRAITLYEANQQTDSFEMFFDLQQLSLIYTEQAQISEATAALERALSLGEALFSPEDSTMVQERRRLAIMLEMQKRYGEASRHYERILEIDTALLGPMDPQIALDLVDLAQVQEQQLDFSSAETLLRRALTIQEEVLKPQDPAKSETLMALGRILLHTNQVEVADRYFQQSLRLVESSEGEDHELLAELFMQIASTFLEYHHMDQAEQYVLRNLDLQKRRLGPQAPEVAEALMFLSGLYLGQGVLGKAEEYYEQVLKIYVASEPTIQDRLLIGGLIPLVGAMERHGAHPQAEMVIRHIQEKGEHLLGEGHPLLAGLLGQLGALSASQKQVEVADDLFTQSLAIKESRGLADHPDVIPELHGMALLKRMARDFTQAESYLRRILQIEQNTYGPDHPQMMLVLEELRNIYALKGRFVEALSYLVQRLRIFSRILPQIMWIRSESEKFQIMQNEQKDYLAALSIIWQHLADRPDARKVGMEAILTRKGIVLSAQTNWHEIFSAQVPFHLRERWEELLKAQSELGKQWLTPIDASATEIYHTETRQLQNTVKELEALLGTQIDRPLEFLSLEGVTVEAIGRALPPKAVLVEFVKAPQYDWGSDRWTGKEHYLAWLLQGNGAVDLIDLGGAQEIEQEVNHFLEAVRQPLTPEIQSHQVEIADNLYTLLWKPLTPFLIQIEEVIVSPDGILNLLPFAALQSGLGRFVIEDYTVVNVNSGRDLLQTPSSLPPSTPLFLAANPDYSWIGSGDQVALKEGEKEDFPMDFVFTPLPSTQHEASLVSSLIKNAEPDFVKTGAAASEMAVLSAPSTRVLHLATHGFFLERVNSQGATLVEAELPQLSSRGSTIYQDPLFRSGLALAGANHANRTTGTVDGLLSAFEVAKMNLHATDLVVLSACDTGYGETRRGEGVYGLRRAFALAGAKHLVMSLWPVWDKEARKQMEIFYTYYEQGIHPAHALRKAQLARISWMRKVLGEAPPSLWAPFMVQSSGASSVGLKPINPSKG